MNQNNYILNIESSVIEALKKLNEQESALTLFVINQQGTVIGTITDGDIRRGLISGLKLDSQLEKFINKKFSFLIENEDNFEKFKKFREEKYRAVPVLDKFGRVIVVYDFSKIKSILPVDAVIMAGGKGSRLLPLTSNTPKPLLKIGNKEIIAYNFDRLAQFGITNQYVTVNYLGGQIESFCYSYSDEINFKIIKEEKYLGTAGSLSLIENFMNDTILLMNSDILTDIDYEDFYKYFIEKDAEMMVASIPYRINLPYAIFETDNGEINSLKEKPNYTYYANAGIYLIKREILKYIPKSKFFNATDLMEIIIKSNKKLLHYPILSYWLDIGKHEDFEKAQKDIAHIDFD